MGKILLLVSILALIVGLSLLMAGGGGLAIVMLVVAMAAGIGLLMPMLKRENRRTLS